MAAKKPAPAGKKKNTAKRGPAPRQARRWPGEEHRPPAPHRRTGAAEKTKSGRWCSLPAPSCWPAWYSSPGTTCGTGPTTRCWACSAAGPCCGPVLMVYVAVITALEKPRGLHHRQDLDDRGGHRAVLRHRLHLRRIQAPRGPQLRGIPQHPVQPQRQHQRRGGWGACWASPCSTPPASWAPRSSSCCCCSWAIMVPHRHHPHRSVPHPEKAGGTWSARGIQNARQRREEERQLLEQERADIGRASGAPAARPTRCSLWGLLPPSPKPESKKKQKEPNEKLDKLKAVFGLADGSAPEPDPPGGSGVRHRHRHPGAGRGREGRPGAEAPRPAGTYGPRPGAGGPCGSPREAPRDGGSSPPPGRRRTCWRRGRSPWTRWPPSPRSSLQKREEGKRREATPQEQFQYQAAQPQSAYCFPPITMLAESPPGRPRRRDRGAPDQRPHPGGHLEELRGPDQDS